MKKSNRIFIYISIILSIILINSLFFSVQSESDLSRERSINNAKTDVPLSSANHPMIFDYEIHNEIEIGESKEFNVTANVGFTIIEAFIIFEDIIFSQRENISLVKKPLVDTYYKDLGDADIDIGLHNAWYGLQDDSGNFNYTDSFSVEIKGNEPYPFGLSTPSTLPDINGFFQIIWTTSLNANNYTVYRYNHYITEINDTLTRLSVELSYVRTIFISNYEDGIYYFIVVAKNDFGNANSTCLKVTVEHPTYREPSDLGKKVEKPEDTTWIWVIIIIGSVIAVGIILMYVISKVSESWFEKKGFKRIKFVKKL